MAKIKPGSIRAYEVFTKRAKNRKKIKKFKWLQFKIWKIKNKIPRDAMASQTNYPFVYSLFS